MYQVEWVKSSANISVSLWDDCFKAPYEGRWWYEALEQAGLDDQFTFVYGIVYDNSQPVAIAPAFIMNVPIRLVVPPALLPVVNILGKIMPSLLYQRTLFIGSPCSDEGRIGMLPQVNVPACLQAVNEAMQAYATQVKAPMRVWKDFSNIHQAEFNQLLKPQKLFKLVSFPGTSLNLQGTNMDGYMASLKASRRGKLKKKLKQAASSPVNVEIFSQPNLATMDEIFSLFWQTYEKGDTKFERLNRQFFDLISSHADAHYVLLKSQDTQKIVAFMLCFKLGEHVVNKFIGIDYTQPKDWFLYFKLWEAAVIWSYSVSATSIQSGQTGYAPKIELGNEMVALTNYCKHQNPLVHWVFAQVAKTVNWDTLDDDLATYVKAYPEQKPA